MRDQTPYPPRLFQRLSRFPTSLIQLIHAPDLIMRGHMTRLTSVGPHDRRAGGKMWRAELFQCFLRRGYFAADDFMSEDFLERVPDCGGIAVRERAALILRQATGNFQIADERIDALALEPQPPEAADRLGHRSHAADGAHMAEA